MHAARKGRLRELLPGVVAPVIKRTKYPRTFTTDEANMLPSRPGNAGPRSSDQKKKTEGPI